MSNDVIAHADPDQRPPLIWIDGDACPRAVKDIVYRAAERQSVKVNVVANSPMRTPPSELIELMVVSHGFDEADAHIAGLVLPQDLVITADVPFAQLVVNKGAVAISPKGEMYDAASIGERLAVRNLMTELRSSGEISGGGRPYSDQDKKAFASAFDRTLTRLLRQHAMRQTKARAQV
jgi:uncharacterized protein YaiI (UPF0178 family)